MNKTPFGFDKPRDSPGFLLWQTTVVWQRLIKKALEGYGLSHPQFVILAITLWFNIHDEVATQGLITAWSKLDKMTVSSSLKKLAALKLIRRKEDPKDTRVKTVLLTPKGKKLISQLIPVVEGIDEAFFGHISTPQQKNLLGILEQLAKENPE